jgi:SnoaL-like domain
MSDNMLQKVADILEIQGLKALYYEILDSARLDRAKSDARLREIVADDVKLDHGPAGEVTGKDQVVTHLMDSCVKPEWLMHTLHSPRVEVNGDIATGYWTGNGSARFHESKVLHTSANRVRAEFRRTPKGWRITLLCNVFEDLREF